MNISMYTASVPAFTQLLDGLARAMAKGQAHGDAAGLLDARLYPDMYPLSWQVLASTEFAKSCVARLAGLDVPPYTGVAGGWDEAKERVRAALAFIAGIEPSQIDGSEDRDIEYGIGSTVKRYKGQPYLLHTAMPQCAFHVTIAYAILRSNGVALVKSDYLAS